MRLGKYNITFNKTKRPWYYVRAHEFSYRYSRGRTMSTLLRGLRDGYLHLILGRLSVVVEDVTAPLYAVCAVCRSTDIGEVSYGDEGLTVCQDCNSIEQGYKYLSLQELEG